MSPGPIFEPEGFGEDWWRTARALFAAGIRKGDIVHNTFAYHLTPGGWILDAGARALGCAVIAAGPGNTEQQLDAIQHFKPTAYVGAPDYLKILLDKAKEAGRDASSHQEGAGWRRRAVPLAARRVQGSAASTRYQTYATADLGIIAYESAALRRHDHRRGRRSSRSCGRAPAIRCRRATSARWSSPPSTATIR